MFLRQRAAQLIRPEEVSLVERALARRGEPWQFKADANKGTIIVYEASDASGLNDLYRTFRGRDLSPEERQQNANYQAVMRFSLVDRETRAFTVERYCFRGRIDDWIWLDGPGTLVGLVRKYVKHVGQDSFFELF